MLKTTNSDRSREQEDSTRHSLLMIGGEPILSWLLDDVLERAGFDVTVETHGDHAIPTIDRGPYDVVVIDREIPGIEGFDLVTYVRHRFPRAQILFITAVCGTFVEQTARERGATRCLEKPFRVEELVRLIRQLVGSAPGDAHAPALESHDAVRAIVGARPASAGAASVADPGDAGSLWGVVLAGGQGTRLRALVSHVHGEPRPKQYARLVGSRSLLRCTLDRVGMTIPERRTVIVALHGHSHYLAEESAVAPLPTVLTQPCDRGTAAGILLPAMWIHRRDPGATIAIFPSDHFVGAAGPFLDHVRDVAAFIEHHPERIVLVGAIPTEPETEYGWIDPGETIGRAGAVVVQAVRRFVEKPSLRTARECLASGAVWNTFVVVARAATLIDAGRQLLPELHNALAAAASLLGTGLERCALRRAYAAVPNRSFSSAILEQCAPALGVSTLHGTTWCDWGSPRRVIRTLRRTRIEPEWLRALNTASAGRR